MTDDQNDALNKLSEIGQEMQRMQEEYEKWNDEWWYSLPYETRCEAFYAVMKRLHKGEIIDQGSYRYVLYDIFGFGPEMYVKGMDSGYMEIHNRIISRDELKLLWKAQIGETS